MGDAYVLRIKEPVRLRIRVDQWGSAAPHPDVGRISARPFMVLDVAVYILHATKITSTSTG